MTNNEISNKLKKRFTKDTGVPIHVFREPYFTYYIDLFEELYDAKMKYDSFLKILSKLGGEELFFEESSAIINGVIEAIKETNGYENFTNFDLSTYAREQLLTKGKKSIFTSVNNKRLFISADLKHANFQALKYFDSDLVLGVETYEQLIKKFTEFSYFINSRQIRQVIFGHLNPKRQRTIQRKIMYDFYSYLTNKFDFFLSSIATTSPDEIVIDVTNQVTDKLSFRELFKEFERILKVSPLKDKMHLDAFTIYQLKPHNFYIKKITWSDDPSLKKLVIKSTPIVFIPQVVKHIKGQETQFEDLLFVYEKRLCQFIDPLEFEEQFSLDHNLL